MLFVMEWKDTHDFEVGLPLGLASSNLRSSGFSSSHPRQFACSMIMLRMMMKMMFPLGAVVIQVYHPVLCPKTVGLFHDDVDNGAGARVIIPVHHLPSRFMPETVGLFHTPAPLTTSYHKLQFLEILSFDRRRSHRVRGNSLTCNFPRAFEALFWNSSVVMIDHQSHIDHYDRRDPRCNSWKSRLLKDLVIQVDLHS